MKPDSILDGLEAEPVVFLGCTWSELTRIVRRSMLISFLSTVVFAFIVFTFIQGIVLFVLSLVFFALVVFITAKRGFNTVSKLRADKPLFYEKHATTHKKSNFIQPPKNYQRERNCDS